jgi:hypothetical protein
LITFSIQKLLEVTKRLLDQILKTHNLANEFMEDEREKLAKLIQLRNVLERDRFEGLNRKVSELQP